MKTTTQIEVVGAMKTYIDAFAAKWHEEAAKSVAAQFAATEYTSTDAYREDYDLPEEARVALAAVIAQADADETPPVFAALLVDGYVAQRAAKLANAFLSA